MTVVVRKEDGTTIARGEFLAETTTEAAKIILREKLLQPCVVWVDGYVEAVMGATDSHPSGAPAVFYAETEESEYRWTTSDSDEE
jgi:hypothetical protein